MLCKFFGHKPGKLLCTTKKPAYFLGLKGVIIVKNYECSRCHKWYKEMMK